MSTKRITSIFCLIIALIGRSGGLMAQEETRTLVKPTGTAHPKIVPDSIIQVTRLAVSDLQSKRIIPAHRPKPSLNPYANWTGTPTTSVFVQQGDRLNGVFEMLEDSRGYLWIGTSHGLNRYDGFTFHTFLKKDGLVDRGINALLEDPLGALWIASNSGLFRYNGFYFQQISFSDGFPDRRVNALHIDSTGILLVATESGLYTGDYGHSEEDHIVVSPVLWATPLNKTFVSSLLEDRSGRLWIGTLENGLFHHNYHELTPVGSTEGKPFKGVLDLCEDPSGTMWILDSKYTVFKFADHQFSPIHVDQAFEPFKPISISCTSNGDLWFGTNGHGAYLLSNGRFIHYTVSDGLLMDYVLNTYEDHKGNIWLGHFRGLTRMDAPVFNRYSNQPNFPAGSINQVAQDKKGRLWFSTDGQGLIMVDGQSVYQYGEKEGLLSAITKNVFIDENNSVWFLEPEYGIVHLDDDVFTYYDSELLPLTSGRNFINDRNGNLWFTGGRGITKFDGTTFTNYVFSGHSTLFWNIYEDRSEKLWFCSNGNEIFVYDGNQFTYYNEQDGLANGFTGIHQAVHDHFGNYWFATENGLYAFDGVRFYLVAEGQLTSADVFLELVQDTVHSLIWGLTDGGLVAVKPIYDEGGKLIDARFESFGLHSGFQFSTVAPESGQGMMIDDQGSIWLAKLDGKLARIQYPKTASLKKENPVRFTSFLINNQLMTWGGRERTGNVQRDSLTVLMEKALSNDKDLVEPLDIKLEKKIKYSQIAPFSLLPEDLVLPYQANNLTFAFHSGDINYNEHYTYQYKLDGLNQTWNRRSTNNTATFANLKEGDYKLHVKAYSPFNVVSNTVFAFQILPPWYRTWWAYLSYFGLLVSFVYIFIGWRTRRLQQEKHLLEDKVNERTAALNESLQNLKNTQSQLIHSEKMASLGELTAGIAHEIQNPLNFVNNFSEVNSELIEDLKIEFEKGNYAEATNILNDLKTNEGKIKHHGQRADAIVKSMLQHTRSSSGQKELTDINALCDEYLRLAYHGFRAKDKNFNAEINLDLDLALPKINVVPHDIGRVLLNLINNAFQACTEQSRSASADPTSADRSVSSVSTASTESLAMVGTDYKPLVAVATKNYGKKIEIRISDNGPGISDKIKDKIFQPFFTTKPTGQGTGLGLSLAYDIVKAHSGEIQVETKPSGSDFIIQLPVA